MSSLSLAQTLAVEPDVGPWIIVFILVSVNIHMVYRNITIFMECWPNLKFNSLL